MLTSLVKSAFYSCSRSITNNTFRCFCVVVFFFILKCSLQGVAVLTPKPSLCLLGPVWEPQGEGGRSGQIRLRPWQARLRGGKGLPGWRLYTALCPKKAREFRNECWSTSVQFATFRLFSALGAASLKHYWVEGSETQVPFAGGQAQRPGSSRGRGGREGQADETVSVVSPSRKLPGEGRFFKN